MNRRTIGTAARQTAQRVRRTIGGDAAASKGLIGLALGAGAALGGLALWNNRRARETEQANPPMGAFMEVAGTRLHYLSRGRGRPVVFVHGLGGMVQDWHLSLLDRAAARHHCVAFDRPGYGYSERPGQSRWDPERQADILAGAARRLGIERPVVAGHDFGALVALAWALDHAEDCAGIVLLSGYYYPTRRLDIPLIAAPNVAGIGAIARNTVSPLLGRQMMPKVMERVFAPNPVPDIMSLYPTEMMLRPRQMRAQAADLAHLRQSARRLARRYGEVRVPTIIVTGDEDGIVDPVAHSIRLHRDIAHSAIESIEGAGHMPHYAAPAKVVAAIERAWHESDVQGRAMGGGLAMPAMAGRPVPQKPSPPPGMTF